MKTTLIVALVLCLSAVWATDLYKVAERGRNTGRWEITREAGPQEIISFKILLKQQNLDKLEQIFWAVSDPQNAFYGKYLSGEEAQAVIAPESIAFESVITWLRVSGIPAESVNLFSDYIQVTTSVSNAANLFRTSFSVYKSSKTNIELIRIVGPAYIPASLKEHVDFVAGISELIDDSHIKPKPNTMAMADQLITPFVLKSYYNIPNASATNMKNLQGIAAFSDYFSRGALAAFASNFSLMVVNVTIIGSDCLGQGCDQYESDLDVQYITSIGLGVPTTFIASNQEGQWVLDWAQNMMNMQTPPLVNSISYGWAELDQCEITSGCSTHGYNSQQYVTRTNTLFQQIGARGISILVSDGDDGAPSLGGASGNCPIDPSKYCPLGGCNHTSSACPSIIVTQTPSSGNKTMCFYPMGIESDACQTVLSDQNVNQALTAWANANSQCMFEIENDRDDLPHFYSSCSCSSLKSNTYRDITIAPYTFNQNNGAIFSADYPTSSPYVTSVAATQFTWNGMSVASEVVCSIETGAIITTGGGFSTFQPQGSYQAAAVAAWVQAGNNLPPSFSYNPKMRAYPDITFNGHNYLIYASNNSQNYDTCPCMSLPVDGTSCSSPALAGLISLINDQLLNAGKSQLGFLNPILYQMFASNPTNFNDIVMGNNNCNRAYCCMYGYTATKGWDPASGLGSPDFNKFLAYAKSAQGL